MSHATGFAPIAAPDARVLILGSMPGQASLAAGEYYAHPRNAFWPTITTLLGDPEKRSASYRERTQLLTRHRIALWDVVQSCFRAGSLDSAIREGDMVANDFVDFLHRQPLIRQVVFNGHKAEQYFHRHVLKGDLECFPGIHYRRLPSTSPAMATLSPVQKLQAWKIVAEYLDGAPDSR